MHTVPRPGSNSNQSFKDAIRHLQYLLVHLTAVMENHQNHALVALQFNLGAASRSRRKRTSEPISGEQIAADGEGTVPIHIGRHLISEYLEQSIFPDPVFIALHDRVTKVDAKTICDALKERETNHGAVYEYEPFNKEDTAALLYNSSVVIYDRNNALKMEDFFNESDTKAAKLSKRLHGGLFQHEASKQFIVAISYHGENDLTDKDKKDYISGRRRLSSRLIIKSYYIT